MPEINMIMSCLHPLIDASTYRQLHLISQTLLMMTGRITILGISRWSKKDGSNRTIQRFFAKKEIAWGLLNWLIVKAILIKNTDVILIAGDATTVTKSGHATHGLGKFFSSIYGRAIPSIAFQTLSLISVKSRKSWPILLEQILPKAKEEKVVADENAEKKIKRGKGRPKGSKNKNHRNPQLNSEMLQVQKMLKQLLKLIKNSLNPAYFIYDGAFGHNAAIRNVVDDLGNVTECIDHSVLYTASNFFVIVDTTTGLPTGHCNNLQVNAGILLFNTNSAINISTLAINTQTHLLLHEFSHLFGLGHIVIDDIDPLISNAEECESVMLSSIKVCNKRAPSNFAHADIEALEFLD